MSKTLNFILLFISSLVFLNLSVYLSMLGLQSYSYILIFSYFFISFIFVALNKFEVRIPLLYFFCYFVFLIVNLFCIGLSDNDFSDYFSKNILYFIYFLFTYFVFFKSYEVGINIGLLFKFLLLLIVFLNVLDFFDQGKIFHQFEGFDTRASGFYVNANNAAYAILACLVLYICNNENKTKWYWFILALIGVFFTLSRGGMIVWFFIYIFSLFLKRIDIKDSLIIMAIPLFFVLNFFILDKLFFSYSNNYNLITDRLNIFSGSSNISQNVEDDSRYALVQQSIDLFWNSPVWGNGFFSLLRNGSSQLNHNQYLLILDDYGLIGFMIFSVMLYSAYSKRNSIIYVFLFSCAFFTHEFFYSYTFLMVFSILLASKYAKLSSKLNR